MAAGARLGSDGLTGQRRVAGHQRERELVVDVGRRSHQVSREVRTVQSVGEMKTEVVQQWFSRVSSLLLEGSEVPQFPIL